MPSKSVAERGSEPRFRTEARPALLSDLYRERTPVTVLNVSQTGIGVKVDELFAINLPVLIEYEGLLIVGNVCHCMKASSGGYVLGMKIAKIVTGEEHSIQQNSGVVAKGAA